MSKEPFTIERFYAELEGYGPLKVREFLAHGRWGKAGTHFELATDWLRQGEEARRSAIEAERIAIDSRAASAAERAAVAAERAADTAERALSTAQAANARATIALVMTAASIIATVILAYLRPS